ncbi:Prenyltransferase-like family protein [Babesia bovis T2Bo]|uniref:Geranylgeranyl transferase type II subunit beta n=1 Tax=Babesia bovis TaxID=5865 RepID=A7AVB5_BABBO|nr:Prenyltransferase-like family protein [Babesia bovis T2Bo]EDO05741.1 Prenyltransferase-like family protein [Babesia bovis T2Bo]|eukprot:XP_001609309.1 Rab geranylgeranyltransferase, beta subunit [Babesia bovis T2Bo]
MDDERRDKILKGIHSYFVEFFHQGMVFVQDTEVMPREILKRRRNHEAQLLKGMYWAFFALHLLHKTFGIATNEQLERINVQENADTDSSDDEECDDVYDSVNYSGFHSDGVPEQSTMRDTSDPPNQFADLRLLGMPTRGMLVADLDTTLLEGKDVDTILRFLKSCQREFVYQDYTFLGFANSDDRRRFTANISSTLMAINTYRLIGDYLNIKSSLGFLKHMSWIYQTEELLSYISLLYVPRMGYYKKSLMPLVTENADIRHTTSAVLSTSISLRISGYQNAYYRMKIAEWIHVDEVVANVIKHFNDDGGVGLSPNSESHCGAAFCAIAIFTVTETMTTVPRYLLVKLKSWLLKRLTAFGGVSGRVGKAEDVCYSFWLLATLSLLNKFGVNSQILRGREMIRFIERCQTSSGGIAPYPCDEGEPGNPDPFHSFAALLTITLIEEERQQAEVSVLQSLI